MAVWWPHILVLWVGAAVTAAAVLGATTEAVRAGWGQLYGTPAKTRKLTRRSEPASPKLQNAAADLGIDTPTQVNHHQMFAFCHGLRRPRIVVSSSLVDLLDADQVRAVLAHEQCHATRRDPLRLAVLRTAARAGFLLPILGDIAQREATRLELRADRAATVQVDRRSLVSALAAVLSNPRHELAVDLPGFDTLETRVAALTGTADTPRLPRGRAVLTALSGALLLVLLATSAWAGVTSARAPVYTVEVLPADCHGTSPEPCRPGA